MVVFWCVVGFVLILLVVWLVVVVVVGVLWCVVGFVLILLVVFWRWLEWSELLCGFFFGVSVVRFVG